MCQPFVILDLKDSLYCWWTVDYYVPVGIFVTLLAFKGPWSKKVIAACQRHFPQVAPRPDLSRTSTLTKEESKKVSKMVQKAINDNYDSPSLGIPPIDVLEETNRDDLEEEIKEMADAWNTFRNRRGSFSNDFDGLKDAYNNFTTEVNEIFQNQKQAASEKQD